MSKDIVEGTVAYQGAYYSQPPAGYGTQEPPIGYQQQPVGYQGYTPIPSQGYQYYTAASAPLSSETQPLNQPQQALHIGQPLYPDGSDPIKTKFISQGYKDVWATVAFAVQLFATVIYAFVNLGQARRDFSDDSGSVALDHSVHHKMRLYLPGAAATSFCLALVMLSVMRVAPRQYIVAANILVILINFSAAIYAIADVSVGVGIVFFIFAGLNALWLYLVRHRIPLAGAILSNAVTVVTRHYGSIVVSFVGLAALIVYCCFWGLMVVPTLQDFASDSNGSSSGLSGSQYFATLLFLLAFYWSTQVCVNVIHVVASGVVATWYFSGPAAMPANPSVASSKRALTTSFGSICFGSLLVAVLKLIYAIVRRAVRHQNAFVQCIALCIAGLLERLMEYFNVYAFTHVAIYGSGYMEAAKQTWEMIRNCGISAIINDNLVFPVLTLTSLVDSVVVAVGFGVAADSVIVGFVAFFISYVIHIMMFRVVYSGVVTIFVCYAECPDFLQLSNGTFFAELQDGMEALKKPIC